MGSERTLQLESAPLLPGRTVLIRRIEIASQCLPDRSVLLFDPVSRISIPISESAGKIWELCDGSHAIDQIVDDLASIYDAERPQIDHDVREFLAVLERNGFIEKRSSPQ
jgi:hypothetical protein